MSTDCGQWWFVRDVVAPDEGRGKAHHLSNHGIAGLLFQTRNQYFESLEVPGGIWEGEVVPLMRELLVRYEGEAETGDHLQASVAITGRSRRSLTMSERLVDASTPDGPRTVATARTIHVTVDRRAGGSVEVPDFILSAIEKLQGSPLPWSP